MRKMGNFRGLPVYLVTEHRVLVDYSEEKMYVIDGELMYHGAKLADVLGGQLFDFDEDKFNELRRKSWSEDESKLLAKTTGSAETRPQEEREPVSETVETAGGIVDIFMSSWKSNIDDEIEKMKKMSEELEKRYHEVG